MNYEEIVSVLSTPKRYTLATAVHEAKDEFLYLAENLDEGLIDYLQECWPYTALFRGFLQGTCPHAIATRMYYRTPSGSDLEVFWKELNDLRRNVEAVEKSGILDVVVDINDHVDFTEWMLRIHTKSPMGVLELLNKLRDYFRVREENGEL